MAATPRFKIFSPLGEYVASCVHLAMHLRPIMRENYLDYVPEIRAYIRGLAADMADFETPPWEEFR